MKILALTLLAFVLISCDAKEESQAQPKTSDDIIHSLYIQTKEGDKVSFKIELALTPEQQAKGLMNRTELPEKNGMLFVFGNEAERYFWMKNTLIRLDMIFIRKDGTINSIKSNALPNDMTSVPSNGPVSAVLEINGGEAAKYGIKAGDVVHHTIFMN